jgi:hypothetical protein
MFELLSHFRFLQQRLDGDAPIQTAHICEAVRFLRNRS